MGKIRIQVNAATTVYTKKDKPETVMQMNQITGLAVPTIEIEDENELRQFAVEFKVYPIRRSHAREALDNLSKAIFQDMEQKGLLGTE